ncbi:MAG TPA: PHP domain-containing protein, partial [Thermomicrobiales bacterium]|nr:PHP domain-containing protein [Thermomicrobiales bacterium]
MRPAPDHFIAQHREGPDRRKPISTPSPARGGRRQRARPSATAEHREPAIQPVPAVAEAPVTDLAWRRIDLHLHTPASADYQQAEVSYLDILRKAEERGLHLIAFTDHNSVRGYADLWREIEDLELLEYLGR